MDIETALKRLTRLEFWLARFTEANTTSDKHSYNTLLAQINQVVAEFYLDDTQ